MHVSLVYYIHEESMDVSWNAEYIPTSHCVTPILHLWSQFDPYIRPYSSSTPPHASNEKSELKTPTSVKMAL